MYNFPRWKWCIKKRLWPFSTLSISKTVFLPFCCSGSYHPVAWELIHTTNIFDFPPSTVLFGQLPLPHEYKGLMYLKWLQFCVGENRNPQEMTKSTYIKHSPWTLKLPVPAGIPQSPLKTKSLLETTSQSTLSLPEISSASNWCVKS